MKNTQSSTLSSVWDAPSSTIGVTFACNGHCILPSRKPGARGGLRIALSLFIVTSILFAVISSVAPSSTATTVAIAIGSCLLIVLWTLFISIIISDPGILPRHISAIAGLVSDTLAVPSNWGLGLSQIQRQNQPTVRVMIKQNGAIDSTSLPVSVKFCITCRIWRPPGTHHCGTCNTCVAGFDHHCDFLGKCIGAGNMKLFILLLWTASVASFFMEGFSVGMCVSAFAGSFWSFDTSIPTWIAGGTLCSFTILCCVCCSKSVQRLCMTSAGLFVAILVTVSGLVLIMIAFVRSTGPDTSLRGLPGLLGIFIYMYTSLFTFGLALTQTGIVSARTTTKAQIEESRRARAAASSLKTKSDIPAISAPSNSMNQEVISSTTVVHNAVEVTTLVNVIQSAESSSVVSNDKRKADEIVEEEEERMASIKTPPTIIERTKTILHLLLSSSPSPIVDFSENVTEIKTLVKAFEKSAFTRVLAAQETGESLQPLYDLRYQRRTEMDPRCLEAILYSTNSDYVDDVIELGLAARDGFPETPSNPVGLQPPQPLKGVIVGVDFLLTNMTFAST